MSVFVVHVESPLSLDAARGGALVNEQGFAILTEAGDEILLEARDRIPQGRVEPIPTFLSYRVPDTMLGPDYAELLMETGDALLQETGDTILIETLTTVQLLSAVTFSHHVHVPESSTRLGVQ